MMKKRTSLKPEGKDKKKKKAKKIDPEVVAKEAHSRKVHRLCKRTCGLCKDGEVDERGSIYELVMPLLSNLLIIWGFALAYLVCKDDFDGQITSFSDALYFSIISHTTIGYGDINANTVNPAARALVNFHLLLVFFVYGATLFTVVSEFTTVSHADTILNKLQALNGVTQPTRYKPELEEDTVVVPVVEDDAE